MVWFYQWPTGFSFIIFVTIVVLIAIVGLYVFRLTGLYEYTCGEHNTIIGIFTGTIGIFLSVILSFIIVTVWNNYTDAELNAFREAQALYLLYGVLTLLSGTESTQQLVITYLENIINVEYPSLNQGEQTDEGINILNELRMSVYGYIPTTDRESILYQESIDWLNQAIGLRIDRYNSATQGIYPVVWWVAVIDSFLMIFMSWFINCPTVAHYILMFVVGVYVSTALFLVLILSYPFEGYSGLTSEPFQLVLFRINNPGSETFTNGRNGNGL